MSRGGLIQCFFLVLHQQLTRRGAENGGKDGGFNICSICSIQNINSVEISDSEGLPITGLCDFILQFSAIQNNTNIKFKDFNQ